MEKQYERENRNSIEYAKWLFLTVLAKANGDQTAKTKALNLHINDDIIATNQFEPFPEGWWASP